MINLDSFESELIKIALDLPKIEDHTTPTLIKNDGKPDDSIHEMKQNVRSVTRVMRLAMSPNKARAIENSVLGGIAGTIMSGVSKLAFDKNAHTFETLTKNMGFLDKILAKRVIPAAAERFAAGNKIGAINMINASAGRNLFRDSVKSAPYPIKALEPPVSGSYRRPGGVVPTMNNIPKMEVF